jgi:hypothetical protein
MLFCKGGFLEMLMCSTMARLNIGAAQNWVDTGQRRLAGFYL